MKRFNISYIRNLDYDKADEYFKNYKPILPAVTGQAEVKSENVDIKMDNIT